MSPTLHACCPQDARGNQTYCNIGKESRLKSMSVRHNLAVRRGKEKEVVYRWGGVGADGGSRLCNLLAN